MAKRRIVSFQVNGDPVDVAIEPRETLLDVLRNRLDLTGTKEGCSNGNCGACTVLVDGLAVDSCIVLGVEMEGRSVQTVEGLARGSELHPLQQAYIDHGGMQCGICTPGFLMATVHLLDNVPNPTEQDIRLWLAGNLCRCTGYDKIVRSVQAAVDQGAGVR
jgi:carbon-monoxide dehydrogenase small subunit